MSLSAAYYKLAEVSFWETHPALRVRKLILLDFQECEVDFVFDLDVEI